MQITIPIKALSVNKAWAGRRFKSSFYHTFERDVMVLLPVCKKMMTGEVEVHFTFYVKNYKMSDVDNMVKPILDLIVKRGYISDDRKIVFMSAEKIMSVKEKIEVEIIEYNS